MELQTFFARLVARNLSGFSNVQSAKLSKSRIQEKQLFTIMLFIVRVIVM